MPVRRGTLYLRDHPASIAGITWGVAVVYAVVLLGIVFARPLRASTPFEVVVGTEGGNAIVPDFLVPAILVLLAISFALVLAGSQRCRLWLRALMFVVVVGLLTGFVVGALGEGSDLLAGGLAIGGLVLVAAWCVVVWTGRTRAQVDAFVFLVLCGATLLSAYAAQLGREASGGGDALVLANLLVLLTYLGVLATPIAFLAGLDAVALGTSVIGEAGERLGRTGAPWVAAVVAAAVIAWQAFAIAPDRWADLTGDGAASLGRHLVIAIAIIAACVLAWWLCHRVAGRADDRADAARVADDAGLVGEPVSYGLTAPLVLTSLVGVALYAGGPRWPEEVFNGLSDALDWLARGGVFAAARLIVVVALLAFAAVMARRRRSLVASVAAIDAIVIAAFYGLPEISPEWSMTTDALGDVGLVLAVVLLAWWAATRSLDRPRMALVLALALLSALIRQADFFSLPFGFLIGASTLALLLVGLVWGFLTDGGSAHDDLPHYPRDRRLLLMLGRSLFGLSIVAWAVIGKEVQVSASLGDVTAQSVMTLGTALIITTVIAAAAAVNWRGPSSSSRDPA